MTWTLIFQKQNIPFLGRGRLCDQTHSEAQVRPCTAVPWVCVCVCSVPCVCVCVCLPDELKHAIALTKPVSRFELQNLFF